MAVDTAQKRADATQLLHAFYGPIIIPDASLTQPDRQSAANIYSGILAGESPVVVEEPLRQGGGVSRARHIRWAPIESARPRKITKAEEQELISLVRSAIDEDDQKARARLERLAEQYKDFQNSLASFHEAFSRITEQNVRKYTQNRISVLAYQARQRDIEEEEQIILQILNGVL